MTIKSCFSLVEEAKQKIKSINFNVLNLENGIDDWIKQNGPIEKINIKKN